MIHTEFTHQGATIWGKDLHQVPATGEIVAIWHRGQGDYNKYIVNQVIWLHNEGKDVEARVRLEVW